MKLRTSVKVLGTVGVITLVFAAGCSSAPDSANDDQSSAVSAGLNFKVVDTDADGVATFIVGELGAAPGAKTLSPQAVTSPLAKVGGTFHVDSKNLVLKKVQKDNIGDTHYRYSQVKNGKPVVNAELILHVRNDKVYAANGNVREDLNLITPNATIAHPDAEDSVLGASKHVTGAAAKAAADTVYYMKGGTLRLVYAVDFTGMKTDNTPVHDTVYVDADSGDIIARHSHVQTAENREVHNTKTTTTLPGATARTEGKPATGEATVDGNYDNLGTTWSCYKTLFNRDSFDNAGAKFISTVHYDKNYDNAYWDGTQMVYGDGDGTELANLAITQDVTAHELTHAVTGDTSNLTYDGESGGLNESMSDIIGNTCEWFQDGQPATPPDGVWQVGEQCWTPATPGDALRYMNDPAKDGNSLDWYPDYDGSQDVHYSSGISNLAFYLMAHGGGHPHNKSSVQVTGIGIQKASQIFYRADTQIYTASTNFAQAKTATEQAASQLGYTADEIQSVTNAWLAVGVGKGTDPGDGGTTDSGKGDSGGKDSGGGDSGGTDGGKGDGGGGGTCKHSECSTGTKLKKTCDPCVTEICAQDSYCCSTKWDSICVGEVKSICGESCN